LAVLFAAILFPVVRSTVFWLLIVAACWLLSLVIVGIVLFVRFSLAIRGPRSLSGSHPKIKYDTWATAIPWRGLARRCIPPTAQASGGASLSQSVAVGGN
jgi:hypothetical protein